MEELAFVLGIKDEDGCSFKRNTWWRDGIIVVESHLSQGRESPPQPASYSFLPCPLPPLCDPSSLTALVLRASIIALRMGIQLFLCWPVTLADFGSSFRGRSSVLQFLEAPSYLGFLNLSGLDIHTTNWLGHYLSNSLCQKQSPNLLPSSVWPQGHRT